MYNVDIIPFFLKAQLKAMEGEFSPQLGKNSVWIYNAAQLHNNFLVAHADHKIKHHVTCYYNYGEIDVAAHVSIVHMN